MSKTYIVAEIGQNHNGDMDIAKELIEMARESGCNAVKTAKRSLICELTPEEYNRPYNSPNSFGKTYGEHRKFLELSKPQHRELKKYANNRGLDYFLSVCDIPSLEFAITLAPPLIKIPSKEILNFPLIDRAIEAGTPIVLSEGMLTYSSAIKLEEFLHEKKISFNHTILCVCTSQYPTELDNINLNRLNTIMKYTRGFSSHIPDPIFGIAAVAMGAKYIEYHVTLDRTMKGTDHKCSLEFEELDFMVKSIRDLEIGLGSRLLPTKTSRYLLPALKKTKKEFRPT